MKYIFLLSFFIGSISLAETETYKVCALGSEFKNTDQIEMTYVLNDSDLSSIDFVAKDSETSKENRVSARLSLVNPRDLSTEILKAEKVVSVGTFIQKGLFTANSQMMSLTNFKRKTADDESDLFIAILDKKAFLVVDNGVILFVGTTDQCKR